MPDEEYFTFQGKTITESAFRKALGITLKRLRGETEYRPAKVAVDTGIDRSYLYDLEAGKKQASLFTLFRLASTNELPASEIVKMIEEALKEIE